MTDSRFALRILGLLISTLFLASIAHAQATRTWVSGVGDDANPCSRTAPCKTFAGAISKTAINGEIDALDPGGFGAVTITKSITIDGTGTLAGVLASPGNAIVINLNDTSGNDPLKTVRLRGLSLSGTGIVGTAGTQAGLRGILVSSANPGQPKLIVEDCIIDSFTNEGILFNANGGELVVKHTTIRNNGAAGIRVDSSGGTTIYVMIEKTLSVFNQEGIRFDNAVRGTIHDTSASNNSLNGFVVTPGGFVAGAEMNLDNCVSANNKQFGIISQGTGSTGIVRITNSEVTNNLVSGLQVNPGGQILSNGKNHITAPTAPPSGAFTDQ